MNANSANSGHTGMCESFAFCLASALRTLTMGGVYPATSRTTFIACLDSNSR